jgi:hypothetical protein
MLQWFLTHVVIHCNSHDLFTSTTRDLCHNWMSHHYHWQNFQEVILVLLEWLGISYSVNKASNESFMSWNYLVTIDHIHTRKNKTDTSTQFTVREACHNTDSVILMTAPTRASRIKPHYIENMILPTNICNVVACHTPATRNLSHYQIYTSLKSSLASLSINY